MCDFRPCPWCEKEVEIILGFENLGDDIPCPHCGKLFEVDGDYVSDDSWGFWLIESPLQIRIDREKELN